jgi:hypothetical protein
MAGDGVRTVVVVVHPGTNPHRPAEILRWLRWLLPAALLVVAPAAVPLGDAYDVITIDADAVESGPLSLADAIARGREDRAGRDHRQTRPR